MKGRSRRVARVTGRWELGIGNLVYITTAAERPVVSSIKPILTDVERPRSGRKIPNQKKAQVGVVEGDFLGHFQGWRGHSSMLCEWRIGRRRKLGLGLDVPRVRRKFPHEFFEQSRGAQAGA